MTTQKNHTWLLPQGIDEVLPPETHRLEKLRRKLLDYYQSCGYDLVIPPLMEYLDSLLAGSGSDLNVQTYKVPDQLTGRTLGIRSDMTPQVARIDAHQIKRDIPVRLCYIGPVLQTLPSGFFGTRSPLQLGLELFGHSGIESDAETLGLMIDTLQMVGIPELHIDLGHVGIFRGLTQAANLTKEQEQQLFDATQRKAQCEIDDLLANWEMVDSLRLALSQLPTLAGGESMLSKARKLFSDAPQSVTDSLNYLEKVAAIIHKRHPELPLYYDLAELRGYHYKTGIVYAAFTPNHGQEIARGGRYDNLGSEFGAARPATGFSTDLKTLTRLSTTLPEQAVLDAIFAPASDDETQIETIKTLRSAGRRVITELPGQNGSAADLGCGSVLRKDNDSWQVVSL